MTILPLPGGPGGRKTLSPSQPTVSALVYFAQSFNKRDGSNRQDPQLPQQRNGINIYVVRL